MSSRASAASDGRGILVAAAWFGLATGLIEAALFLACQRAGRLTRVSIEIGWISPLVDLGLFFACGAIIVALGRVVAARHLRRGAMFLFSFLAVCDWLFVVLAPRLRSYAILVLAVGTAWQASRWIVAHEAAARRFMRRTLRGLVGVALLVFAAIESGTWIRERIALASLPVAPAEPTNVLLIVLDTLRADHLSAYGYGRPTSPRLDSFAKQGVLFENAFSTTSWTLPSHASLFTGRYSREHRASWKNPGGMFSSGSPTLAEVLRSRGYRTAAFSANPFWVSRETGLGRGFIRFEDYCQSVADGLLRTAYGRAFHSAVLRRLGFEDIPARRRAQQINGSVLSWIRRDPRRPFFVFANYIDTHDPYLPPEPFASKFSPRPPRGILNTVMRRFDPSLTAAERQAEIDAYDGAIAYLDHHLGRLLDELEGMGLADNTLVVITSDHGEAFGEHGLFLHSHSLYRELVHVPLLVRLPGWVPAGVRVSQPVTNAAVAATVVDLIGAGSNPFPGPSLALLWRPADDPVPEWPAPAMELERMPWKPQRYPVRHGSIESLVTPRWHFIRYEKWGPELYDWRADPEETRNLAAGPEGTSQLAAELDRILEPKSGPADPEP
jgi:arylsulfatase A-like enzyme